MDMSHQLGYLGAVFLGLVLAVPTSQAQAQETFYGYPCTDDCSGHQAGYDWAEQNDITDSGDCGGNSQSFIEGCEAYAEEYGSYDDEETETEEGEEEE
jgi:hypothetical protein